ncbi:hypothetical protein [Methanobrevibacter sp.]|uniref:hypothetical protein n=1 Tax=Methanobrevibacter sp. TaxID=66852 RepID=UPI0038709850
MKYKSIILLALTVFIMLGIAAVSASDANYTAISSEDIDDVISMEEDTKLASFEENEILTADEQTFAQLNETINGKKDKNIYLNSSYKYSKGDDNFTKGIIIDRDVNIYGNGHTIDANNTARIFQIKNGNVIFYNITFKNGNARDKWNDYGGAINGNCKAINCTFTHNHAYRGGAMYGGSAVNCTFNNNTANWDGSAMYGGSAVNCTFNHNNASDSGGAMADGSAVNCTFNHNTANDWGGAMRGGSAVNCTFNHNNAASGGAMDSGSAVNCTFNHNTANREGGAMRRGSAVNCTFNYNTANNYGGAMAEGSAVNCTFNYNKDLYGYAMQFCYYKNCNGDEHGECTELVPSFDMMDHISKYYSNQELLIKLINQKGWNVDFIDVECIIFYNNGSEILRKHGLSGFNIKFDLAAGNYTALLNVTYSGLTANSKKINLTINKATPKIEVQAHNTTYPGNIVVYVKSDVGGEYAVSVGGVTQNVNLTANQVKNITFTGLPANENGYIVNVTNLDHENCTAVVNDTVKVIVYKATPKIEVQTHNTTYPGSVVVYVKSNVGGFYVVKIGDQSQILTLNAGVEENISFAGLPANENGYTVNVTYNATENYTGSVNDTVVVKIRKAPVKINSQDITVTYNIDGFMIVRLTDINGNPIGGAVISVDLNGPKTYTTNSNGEINISTTGLSPKTYTAKITFAGNNNYTESSSDYKVIINKATPKLTAKKKTYKVKSKTKKFTITLKDNTGKPIKNAKVRLIVKKIVKQSKKKSKKKSKSDKKKNYAKTNNKGKATFKVLRNKPGKYNAKVKFYGDQYYNKATKTVKITIK